MDGMFGRTINFVGIGGWAISQWTNSLSRYVVCKALVQQSGMVDLKYAACFCNMDLDFESILATGRSQNSDSDHQELI